MEPGQIRKVFISDDISKECVSILSDAGIEVKAQTKLSTADLIKALQGYDGLIVRSGTKVTAEIINQTNLKVIGRAGTGVDNIDVEAASAKGVVVVNTPDGNSRSAAELTCALIMSLARKIPQACASLKTGAWERKAFMGNEVHSKTLGLIGFGRIGKIIARRMQRFGMTIIAYDPIVPYSEFADADVERVDLDTLWPSADFISVHVPLIKPTANMVNASTLAKCKKGAYILNVARGGIVNEADLVAAINSGHIGGAALDVFVDEPPTDKALLENPKIIVTPHLGASTQEAQLRVAKEIATQFVAMNKGLAVSGALNAPLQAVEDQGYMKLARQLAVVLDGLTHFGAPSSKLQLTVPQYIVDNAKGLTAEVSIGFLRSRTEANLNLVNCMSVAKKEGLEVVISAAPVGTCVQLSSLDAAGQPLMTLCGTKSDKGSFLCSIDGSDFYTPVPLSNKLVFCPADAEQQSKNDPDVMFYNRNDKWQVYGYTKKDVVPPLPAVKIIF